jgi:biotin operon repressor
MSNSKAKWDTLPRLQKRIILSLAQDGPQTRNEIAHSIGSAAKDVYVAFESLKEKGLVEETDKKFYRQQNFDVYWLSDKGLFMAIFSDVDFNLLRLVIGKVFSGKKERESRLLLLELLEIVGKDTLRLVYHRLMQEPKVTDEAILSLFYQAIMEEEKRGGAALIRKVRSLLRTKYPDYYPIFQKGTKETAKKLMDAAAVLTESEGVEP